MKDTELTPLDQSAWDTWVEYRKNILKKPLNPLNYENTKLGLRRFGVDQMAVVRQSMENDYQGLFPLKKQVFQEHSVDPSAPW